VRLLRARRVSRSLLRYSNTRRAPHRPRVSRGRRLLSHLIRRPRWVCGMVAMLLGGGLHLLALQSGPLVLVQPLGVSAVVFALPLAAALRRYRVQAWGAGRRRAGCGRPGRTIAGGSRAAATPLGRLGRSGPRSPGDDHQRGVRWPRAAPGTGPYWAARLAEKDQENCCLRTSNTVARGGVEPPTFRFLGLR